MLDVDRREAIRRALPDILAGAIFLVIGAAFALQSLSYEIGDPLRMGPGFFPLLLGVVLAVLGVLVVISGFLADEAQGSGLVPWRGVVLIAAAFILFGLTVRGLGVVPSLFLTTLLSGLASERVRPIVALVIAAGLTLLSVVIFVALLQLRLPLFGPWLRF